MLSWMQEAAKMNPFSSPFTTAKCQMLESGARPLVANRNIVAASVAEGGQ